MNRSIAVLILAAGIFVGALAVANETELLAKADALFAAKKWEPAQAAYEAALPALKPEQAVLPMTRLAYCLQRRREYDEAIATYRKVTEWDAATPVEIAAANLKIGYCMRMRGQHREAIPVLAKAWEDTRASSTTRAEGLLYAAWAHGVLEEPDKAITLFRKIEDIPEVHGNYPATAALSIGRILQDRGDFEGAIAAYRKIAGYHPVASGNKSRARIYLLECEALLAGDNPFHIKPWVSEVGPNTAKIRWVSQGEPPASEVVVRAEAPAEEIAPAAANVTEIQKTTCHLHTTVVSGLLPGAKHSYTVKSGGEAVEGAFRTAANPDQGFGFCVIGDTQSYNPNLQPLLDAMGAESSDFTIHVGDLVDRGDVWGEWKAGFFDPGHPYLKNAALWPVYGNHDGGPFYPAFFKRERGLFYSFDWGNAHFVVLDSYGSGSGGSGRAKQLEWLEADLAATDKRWIIVALHVPMVATRTAIPKFGQGDFLPVLERYGADIVFSGHHPHYRRYRPIGPQGSKPILHITTGGGGGPVGGSRPSPLLVRGVDSNHFTHVRIEGDTVSVRAKSIEGEVIDAFELRKEGEFFEKSWMDAAVDTELHRQVIAIYHELLTEGDHCLQLRRGGADSASLILDFARLPRGPLEEAEFPENARLALKSTAQSSWKLPEQSIALSGGEAKIQVAEVGAKNGQFEVELQLQIGEQALEAVTAQVELLAPKPD